MTVQPRVSFKSIMGRRLGLGAYGELASNSTGTPVAITHKAVTASAVIGAEASDARAITVTLKDAHGVAIDSIEACTLEVYTDSTMADWSAGGSTGLAQGASGKLLALVAKKSFRAITTSAGVIAISYTDTGTTASYLGVILGNGNRVGLGVMTNA